MEGSLVKLMPYVVQNIIILIAILCKQNKTSKKRGSSAVTQNQRQRAQARHESEAIG
jgi:hypothetical protein